MRAILCLLLAIEGNWLGTVKAPNDTAEIGFEIRRGTDGSLEASAYLPLLNLYGVPWHVKEENGAYVIQELNLPLTLHDDKLEGVTSSTKSPVVLTRTNAAMPSDPQPAGPKGPEPLWQTKLGGNVYAAVALRDGVAYVGTTGGVFNAVSLKDGKFVWAFPAGRPIHGEALVTADAVYFTCDNGFLFKLDRATGKEIWKADLGDANVPRILPHPGVFDWDYSGAKPARDAGVIYAGSGDGSMNAFRDADGSRVWRYATGGKIRSDALVHAGRVYFGSLDGNVYAVDAKSGAEVWKFDTQGPVVGAPALIANRIVAGNRGPGLVALDPATGALAWKAPFWGSWVESTAVPFGDRFYIGASDLRRVTCYDSASGTVVWRTDVFGWNWGRPLVTDELVYVGVAGGSPYMIRHTASLTALDRASGRIVWRWVPPASNAHQWGFPAGPSIEGTTLVIASIDGTLFAFRSAASHAAPVPSAR